VGLEPLYPTTFSFAVLLIRCCKTHGWPAKGANPLAALVTAASVLGEPIRSRLIESIIEFGFVLPKQLYHRIIFLTIYTLFGLLGVPTLAKADAWPAAVFVDVLFSSSRKARICDRLYRSALYERYGCFLSDPALMLFLAS